MTEPGTFFQNTIAMVYDFDGTLSPQPMQEYTVLPELGIAAGDFWAQVDREARRTGAEPMLVYMRLLLEEAQGSGKSINRQELAGLGGLVRYFPGVEEWFDLINGYVAQRGNGEVGLKHYIVSAGNKEILEGVSVQPYFSRIYASEFHFDQNDQAVFPKVLITDTSKTQFLFRINKGKEELHEEINEHMAPRERSIPFANMIYIGDGASDVPSMVVTRMYGGRAVAVYNPAKASSIDKCKALLQARRVDTLAEADYRAGRELHRRVLLLLDAIIANIHLEKELFDCRGEYGLPDTRL